MAYDAAPAFDPALATPGRSDYPLAAFGVFAAPAAVACGEPGNIVAPTWTANASRDEHAVDVAAIRDGIRAGDFYQVNHTIRFRAPDVNRAEAIYAAGMAAQGDCYGVLLDVGGIQIASLSPELFFALRGRTIEMRPMKGTARRGRWAAEDRENAARLGGSIKERAENVMIVDLIRNDVGRIAFAWGR